MDGKGLREYMSAEIRSLMDTYKNFQTLIPSHKHSGAGHPAEDGRFVETLIKECLRKYLPKGVSVIGVEPAESPLFTEGKAELHKIQGIGANFIPELTKGIELDKIITVKSDEAIEEAKSLAKERGIFAGISAGANLIAAKEIAKENPNDLIVVIIPDSGDRYLSVF